MFLYLITGNTSYIKDLLDRFEDPRQVPNWVNQGSIILDYLEITAKVDSFTISKRLKSKMLILLSSFLFVYSLKC